MCAILYNNADFGDCINLCLASIKILDGRCVSVLQPVCLSFNDYCRLVARACRLLSTQVRKCDSQLRQERI